MVSTSDSPMKLSPSELYDDLDSLKLNSIETKKTQGNKKDDFLGITPDSKSVIYTLIDNLLRAGEGETVLDIGVDENGVSFNFSSAEFQNCIEFVTMIANELNADVTILQKRNKLNISATPENDTKLKETLALPKLPEEVYGHTLIRTRAGNVEKLLEIRIAVLGNVDAGKSTLLGVLTKDMLDDGRGKARVNLFRHKHEIESGRTSSIGVEILGFDSRGKVITPENERAKLTWDDICIKSSKVFSFIDLAGHEKYLKTTVFGMTGGAPDYVVLLVGANSGIIGMTKEHLGLAVALQIPVFIVITKIDMCPLNVLESNVQNLVKVLKSSGCKKIPLFVSSIDDVIVASNSFVSERICPIFRVSNVTGEGLDLLKIFMNILKANCSGKYKAHLPLEYQITDTFQVPGVGTVVSGTILSGIVHMGDTLLLGPDYNGNFVSTMVKGIQRKRVNVLSASAGQSVSFALKKIKRSAIRKGMVMVSKALDPKAYFEFEAEVLVLYHQTTIVENYQAMVHCGCVRQTAKIVGMDKQILRTGERAFVRFRFLQTPEYLKPGARLLFREGRTKGVGKIIKCVPESESLLLQK